MKSPKPATLIKLQLIMFEKQICDSHFSEKLFKEKVAVTKIQEDTNHFFIYTKKFSSCKTGHFINSSTHSLNNNKYEICRILVSNVTPNVFGCVFIQLRIWPSSY